jgi:hypothetical protein
MTSPPPPPGQPGGFPPPQGQPGGFPPAPMPPAGPPGGPPQYGGAPVAGQSTNGKAIASLVLGIVGLFCIGWPAGIAAIILGRIAKREIDAGQGTGSGMATAGLIMGIISVVVYGLLTILWLILVIAGN